MNRTVLQPPTLACDTNLVKRFGARHAPSDIGRVERRVVWNLLAHLVEAGFVMVGVDGDTFVSTPTPDAVMEEAFSLADDALVWVQAPGHGRRWIKLVWGNGSDCVSDWGYKRGDPDKFNEAMERFESEAYA